MPQKIKEKFELVWGHICLKVYLREAEKGKK
jgi:hypothetical protein